MLSDKQIKAIEETWGMKLEIPSLTKEKYNAPDYYFFSRRGKRKFEPLFDGGKPGMSYEYIEISFINNDNCLQIEIDDMDIAKEMMKLAKILEEE